jgi:protein FAM50
MDMYKMGLEIRIVLSYIVQNFREKERLAKEWRELQEKEKNEEINVAYCYWDGSSHRKDMKIKKGFTISQFLSRALDVEF